MLKKPNKRLKRQRQEVEEDDKEKSVNALSYFLCIRQTLIVRRHLGNKISGLVNLFNTADIIYIKGHLADFCCDNTF